jgi:hypothetical protein
VSVLIGSNVGACRFVHSPKDDLGHVKRSFMSSNIIYINTAHPDFVVRAGGNASIMVYAVVWFEAG